ncbi:MAG: hypothetical protein CMM15_03345 [Rhodospirillaceae bacterium]|nr:hypothetical protein [Rhodospirillaceae bacterium]
MLFGISPVIYFTMTEGLFIKINIFETPSVVEAICHSLKAFNVRLKAIITDVICYDWSGCVFLQHFINFID